MHVGRAIADLIAGVLVTPAFPRPVLELERRIAGEVVV